LLARRAAPEYTTASMTELDASPPAHRRPLLSRAQLAAYARDGFVVCPQWFTPGEVARISAWTDELAARPQVPGRHMVYEEDDLRAPGRRILQRIENFCPWHEEFAALCAGPRLLGCVEALLGERCVLFKDKINFKLPGGDGFKRHQDQQAGWSEYASLFVTALVGIDATTAENGWLELAAGHHRRGLAGREWEPLSEAETADMRFEPVATQPGDVVFFDSYVPHGSGPNRGDSARRVLYITYNRAAEGDHRAAYFAAKRKSFPPDIEREPGKTYRFRV
jgi:hypothetical protein